MKKIFVLLACLLCMTATVYAAEYSAEISDYAEKRISINGNTDSGNEKVHIFVVNPGASLEEAYSNTALIQYQAICDSDETGKFNTEFTLNTDRADKSGYYTVYIGTDNAAQELKVYYALLEDQVNAIREVLSKSGDECAKAILDNAEVFDIGEELHSAIDTAMAEKLLKYFSENPIDMTDTEKQKENAVLFQNVLKTKIVIEAYNKSMKDVLFESNGGFKYSSSIRLEDIDKDGVTLYSFYNESISQSGKQKIQSELLGQNYADENDLHKEFKELVLYYGLTDPKDNGYGHISKLFTSANAKSAGVENSIPSYIGLKNKTSADMLIMSKISTITQSNYLSVIESCAKDNTTNIPVNRPKGGGTGSQVIAPIASPSPAPITEKGFRDIGSTEWARTAIEYLKDKGIISGISETEFAPLENITREQAAKIICLAFDAGDDGTPVSFTDIQKGMWYEEYISRLCNAGYINGISKNLYGVGENITRQDFVTIIYRIVKADGAVENTAFSDSGEFGDYAAEAINFFAYNKIVNGYEDNTFRPKNSITRAEAAQIVYNIIRNTD